MLWNTLFMALREIRRNAMRSALTTLGIVIGVAAVITMVTLGSGATAQVTADIANLGSNLILVIPGQRDGRSGTAKPFSLKDSKAIDQDITGVAAVAPTASKTLLAIYSNQNWSTKVTGIDNAYLQVRKWSLTAGREFTPAEARAGKPLCILGATVRQKLFGAQDPLNASIRLKNLSCQVIGVLESKRQSIGADQDDFIAIPLRAFQRRIAGNQDINSIHVSAKDGVAMEKVRGDIELLMRKRRHISPAEEHDFSVIDMKEIISMVTGTTRMLTVLLGAIAAVSLLVGGVGIMNIMLVSVTERTREIGIRLAVGAREREVLLQFLVEAIMLSSLGGLGGIVLGLTAAAGGTNILGVPFVFDPTIVMIAFVFSGAVGVIFGYFPARQAARLDPIDALRYE